MKIIMIIFLPMIEGLTPEMLFRAADLEGLRTLTVE
jgi:hypothetical protein